MTNELTIYIADDHPIVVDGLIEILHSRSKWAIKGIAYDGEQLINLIINNGIADVIILDINMPKMNGIQCTEWIKKRYPLAKVIILTMFPEKTYIDQLVKIGADGCLLKSRGSKDLLDAIERVSSNRSYFDSIKDFVNENKGRPEYKLSEREIEIIRLIVTGLTSAEIAQQLFLSEHTIKTHRKNIFKKLNLNHVSQLSSFAINNNLLGG